MSWNTNLKVNNLINRVNQIVASSVTNPLTQSLNLATFDITNVGTITTQNLSAPTGGVGAYGQKLTKNVNNTSLAWVSDRQQFTVYCSALDGNDVNINSAGSITAPFRTINHALGQLAAVIPIGARCVIYLFPGYYTDGFTLDTTAGGNYDRLNNISIIGMTNTIGTALQNKSASPVNAVIITTICTINVVNTISVGTTINDYNISLSNINFSVTNSRALNLTGRNHCFYMNNCDVECTITAVPSFPIIDINAAVTFSIDTYFNNCNISHNSSTNYSGGSDNSLLKCNRGAIKELNNCYLYSTPVNSNALFVTNVGTLETAYNTTIISNGHPNCMLISSANVTNTTFNLCTFQSPGGSTQPMVNLAHLNGTYYFTNCILRNATATYPAVIYIGVGSNIILYSIKNRFESESVADQTFNPFGLSSTYGLAQTSNIIGYNNDTFINKLFTTSNTINFPALSTNFTAISEINSYAAPVSTVFYVDGTVGSNTNKGSSSAPFKTVQYALNKCVGNTLYYTIYVNPGTYAEALTITCPRVNLIGVQSNQNTKSVSLQTILINTVAISGASIDIITISNFLIGSTVITTHAINVSSAIANTGGYSLYLNNCEITAPQSYSALLFNPQNYANTRYYITRCNILNNSTPSTGQPIIAVNSGALWQFDSNVVTNRAPSESTLGLEIIPLSIGTSFGGIIGGLTNSSFTSNNQGICFVTNSTNGNGAFTISDCVFNFKTVIQGSGATNLYSSIVSVAKNTINIISSTFINNATTSALSQQPFILLNQASVVYSRNNSYNMIYAPTTVPESSIYPVGNYGTNATLNGFQYQGSIYTNGSTTLIPIPYYPSVSPLISKALVVDLPAGGGSGGVTSVSNGTTYASGYLASISGAVLSVNTPNQNLNIGSNVSLSQLTLTGNGIQLPLGVAPANLGTIPALYTTSTGVHFNSTSLYSFNWDYTSTGGTTTNLFYTNLTGLNFPDTGGGIYLFPNTSGSTYGANIIFGGTSVMYMRGGGDRVRVVNGLSDASPGVVLISGNSSWGVNSDIRIKNNIIPYASSSLDKLNGINVVNYTFVKDEQKKERVGFIAQNVKDFIPDLVCEDKNAIASSYDLPDDTFTDNPLLSINTSDGMIPYLVKAIQELSQQVKELQQQVINLQNK